jgi:Ca2+-binding EF-hand superfamily protein
MKKLLIGGAAAALAFGMAPAVAQTAPPPGVAQGTTPVAPPAPRVRTKTQTRLMFMGDKVITRDEVVAHVRDVFARLDTNHDGYLTREELDAARDKMMSMHGDMEKKFAERGTSERNAMFDKLDTNHDGTISRQEFMAGQSQMREQRIFIMRHDGGAPGVPASAPGGPGTKMRMHGMGMDGFAGHMFEMADTNKDGRVSLAEAQAAALAHFDKADLNHDGKLTPEERQQAHQQHREGRRPS